MNKQAVYHAIKSNYSFPVSDNELIIRLRAGKGGRALRGAHLFDEIRVDGKKGKNPDVLAVLG